MAFYPDDMKTQVRRALPRLYRNEDTEATARTGTIVNQVFVLALHVLSLSSASRDAQQMMVELIGRIDGQRQRDHRIPSIFG